MNGRKRHIERRRAAQEKEAERWHFISRQKEATERVLRLKEKGVDVGAILLERGINIKDAANYNNRLFDVIEEIEKENS